MKSSVETKAQALTADANSSEDPTWLLRNRVSQIGGVEASVGFRNLRPGADGGCPLPIPTWQQTNKQTKDPGNIIPSPSPKLLSETDLDRPHAASEGSRVRPGCSRRSGNPFPPFCLQNGVGEATLSTFHKLLNVSLRRQKSHDQENSSELRRQQESNRKGWKIVLGHYKM